MKKELPNGCSYDTPWAAPSKSGQKVDWQTTNLKSALKLNWYVQCTFFDPQFKNKYPNGFPFRKRCNAGKTCAERRALIEFWLSEIPKLFEDYGYNPITKKFAIRPPDHSQEEPPETESDLSPLMFVGEAFTAAQGFLQGGRKYLNEIKYAVGRFVLAANLSGAAQTRIKDLTFAQFSKTVSSIELTDKQFNKYRSYLSSVFRILLDYDCCSVDLALRLKKRRIAIEPREVLSMEDRRAIMEYLKTERPHFYRYCQIFFYSTSRSSELFSVKAKHVRLDDQEYDVLIKKGRSQKWVTKVILPDAVDYWREALGYCTSADDFVFSAGFIAGPEPSQSEMPTKQWYRNVKSKLRILDGVAVELSVLSKNDLARSKKITADFYTQKHLFIDTLSEMQDDGRAVSGQVLELISSLEISEDQKARLLAAMGAGPGFDISQRMAAHTTSTITNKVYKVGKEKRDNEFLKTLSLKL